MRVFILSLLFIVYLTFNGSFGATCYEKNGAAQCKDTKDSKGNPTPVCDTTGVEIPGAGKNDPSEYYCVCRKGNKCDKDEDVINKNDGIREKTCQGEPPRCQVTKCKSGMAPKNDGSGCQDTQSTGLARQEYQNDYALFEQALENAQVASAALDLAEKLVERDEEQMEEQKEMERRQRARKRVHRRQQPRSRLYQYDDGW